MVIGIIGAGASGMAAALAASENENVQVVLLERQARVGRKLAATGNGRCNLTNLAADHQGYHGDEPTFAEYALKRYDVQATLSWFRELDFIPSLRNPAGYILIPIRLILWWMSSVLLWISPTSGF